MIQIDPKPHGLILENPTERDYMFGAGQIEGDIIVKSGDWTDYLPDPEYQNLNNLETYNCVAFGTLNALEVLLRKKYGVKANFSDRYLGYMAGSGAGGNSPQKVIETLRNYAGAVAEGELPFSADIDTLAKYYSGVDFPMKLKGVGWLRQWEVKHEWVFEPEQAVSDKRERILDALKFSPVCVSVQAWSERNGVYVKTGSDNHWVMLFRATKNYYYAFDHYDQTVKRLSSDYDFYMAKRYHIEPRKDVTVQFITRVLQGLSGLY